MWQAIQMTDFISLFSCLILQNILTLNIKKCNQIGSFFREGTIFFVSDKLHWYRMSDLCMKATKPGLHALRFFLISLYFVSLQIIPFLCAALRQGE